MFRGRADISFGEIRFLFPQRAEGKKSFENKAKLSWICVEVKQIVGIRGTTAKVGERKTDGHSPWSP
jgi:hypothetical protein